MAAKKASPAFDYVTELLREQPDLTYADVKTRAEADGHKVFPIVYGRVKALLGLVPVAPRGSKKKERESAVELEAEVETPAPRRGPGRPRKTAPKSAARVATNGSPMDSLGAVIESMKQGEAEKQAYREALEEIQAILNRVL